MGLLHWLEPSLVGRRFFVMDSLRWSPAWTVSGKYAIPFGLCKTPPLVCLVSLLGTDRSGLHDDRWSLLGFFFLHCMLPIEMDSLLDFQRQKSGSLSCVASNYSWLLLIVIVFRFVMWRIHQCLVIKFSGTQLEWRHLQISDYSEWFWNSASQLARILPWLWLRGSFVKRSYPSKSPWIGGRGLKFNNLGGNAFSNLSNCTINEYKFWTDVRYESKESTSQFIGSFLVETMISV